METGTSTSGNEGASTGIPPAPEEDSGLHDIRNLAASTMERISSKRISASTIKTDDELLASTSGSWKNLALPQPANMISLPELAELPAADVVKDKPAVGAAIGARATRSRRGIAIAGVGLAAAAGVTLFLTTRGTKSDAEAPAETATQAVAVAAPVPAAAAEPTVQHIADPAPAGGAANAAAAGSATVIAIAEPAPAPPAPIEAPKAAPVKKLAAKHASAKPVAVAKSEAPAPAETKAKAAAPATTAPGKPSNGQESFDALLKEAGVQDDKKVEKPTLAAKELSASDFKTGMSAITNKAQACYKGTQGMAKVKLEIAPSGKVLKVTVSGAFANKPEATCVAAAVKSATFPPWDGGPQTMGYSFLLSE